MSLAHLAVALAVLLEALHHQLFGVESVHVKVLRTTRRHLQGFQELAPLTNLLLEVCLALAKVTGPLEEPPC